MKDKLLYSGIKDKLLWSGIITGIIFCISYVCFAGEQEELQLKEALYNEMLQNAQGMIQHAQFKAYFAQTELKSVQSRLDALKRQAEEAKKLESKKEEVKK